MHVTNEIYPSSLSRRYTMFDQYLPFFGSYTWRKNQEIFSFLIFSSKYYKCMFNYSFDVGILLSSTRKNLNSQRFSIVVLNVSWLCEKTQNILLNYIFCSMDRTDKCYPNLSKTLEWQAYLIIVNC